MPKEEILVTKREVLEELTLPKLKRIASRLGVQVRKGITSFLGERTLGVELRRPYIESLANSPIVTLDEIDRVLATNFSGKSIGKETRAAIERGTRQRHSQAPEEEASNQEEAQRGLDYILDRYLYKEDL